MPVVIDHLIKDQAALVVVEMVDLDEINLVFR